LLCWGGLGGGGGGLRVGTPGAQGVFLPPVTDKKGIGKERPQLTGLRAGGRRSAEKEVSK